MDAQKIFILGEPSIDHITTLHPDARSHMDLLKGIWRLQEDSYFAFVADQKIYKIYAGRKWSVNPLLLSEKHTLTQQDKGFVVSLDFTPERWERITRDKNAILAQDYRQQFGGPAKNSLQTMAQINNTLSRISPSEFHCLFLGGYDLATERYSQVMGSMDIDGSTISSTWLRDSGWTIHEAFSFVQPFTFRTMIRYQEKLKSFDPETIQQWFDQNKGILQDQDILYINSLKNPDVIAQCARIVRESKCRVIVAPTNDMMRKSHLAQEILKAADTIICNMEELCVFLRIPFRPDIPIEEQQRILLRSLNECKASRFYVSGEGGLSWCAQREKETRKISSQQAMKIPCRENINAGDIWTGAILSWEFSSDRASAESILRWATEYTSARLSGKEEMPALSQSGQRNAMEVWK